MRPISLLSGIMLFVCGICSSALAQTPGPTYGPAPPIELRYADSLVGRVGPNGEQIRELVGNVQLAQGNVTVTCNRAIQYMGSNRAELIGSVRIVQESLTLIAPRVDYDGSSGTAVCPDGVRVEDRRTTVTARRGTYLTSQHLALFRGDVLVDDDSLRIWSDALDYERSSQNTLASGNVLVRSKAEESYLLGDTVLNRRSEGFTRALGSPMLVRIDTAGSGETMTRDTLAVSADTLDAFRGEQGRYLALGSVEITRGQVAARARRAEFQQPGDYIYLRGNPLVWADSTQLKGDSIDIYMPERRLRAIVAVDSSSVIMRDTASAERMSQVSGQRITVTVDNDSLRSMLCEGNARSLYFMIGERGPDGLARNAADTIRVEMAEGRPSRIYWLGAVTGEFVPELIVSEKAEEFYLPNVRWEPGRPRRRPFAPKWLQR